MNNERHQLASDGCPEFTSRSLLVECGAFIAGRPLQRLSFRFGPLLRLPLHGAKRYLMQYTPACYCGLGRALRTGSGGLVGGAIGSKLDFMYSSAFVS